MGDVAAPEAAAENRILVESSANRSPLTDGSANRPACTECQRRKQGCNRQWPCSNCHKRKVADRCTFNEENVVNGAWKPSENLKLKRERSADSDTKEWDAGQGLEAMGYTTSHILASLEIGGTTPENHNVEQYRLNPKESPQLKRAIDVLPERSIIDTLIQNFLDNVNFYYYVVYPPRFLKEYDQWWTDRTMGGPIGVPWTCLLIMVCACSAQHTDAELRRSLEKDLKLPVRDLSDKYHNASRELHSVIPVGNNHMFTVQYLLHSCYWFKAEARFVECWHVLGSAVREAQMLGLHKESAGRINEFDREMRRRLWCIVDAWDWLVSALLARPMLIDRADSAVGLPSLTLESYNTSPLLHMKLQSDLVARIFKRFGPPKLFTEAADIREYQVILESFMKTFPPTYAFENTDTSEEKKYPWIALHRHYMHTCTLSIALGPFRPFLAKNMSSATTPQTDLEFRRDGVSYALRLMDAVHSFFQYVWERDTTFHFVPFCIFDTAALLCSAFLHDEDASLPRRDEVLAAIDRALVTLKRLSTATDTAKTPLDILRRLHIRIRAAAVASGSPVAPAPAPAAMSWPEDPRKRSKTNVPTPRLQDIPQRYEDIPLQPGAQAAPMSMPYVHVGSGIHGDAGGLNGHHPSSGYGLSPEYSDGGASAGSQTIYTDGSGTTFTMATSSVSHGASSSTMPPPPQQQLCAVESVATTWSYVPDDGQVPMASTGLDAHHGLVVSAAPPQMYAPMSMPQDPSAGMGSFEMVTHDVGDLAEMWNWQSLDLGFGSNPMLPPPMPQQQAQQQQYEQQQYEQPQYQQPQYQQPQQDVHQQHHHNNPQQHQHQQHVQQHQHQPHMQQHHQQQQYQGHQGYQAHQ